MDTMFSVSLGLIVGLLIRIVFELMKLNAAFELPKEFKEKIK